MTGPQHYAEAEQLMAFADEKGDSHRRTRSGADPSAADLQRILADAQIHATLGLAAATALGTSPAEGRAWTEVAGTKYSSGA